MPGVSISGLPSGLFSRRLSLRGRHGDAIFHNPQSSIENRKSKIPDLVILSERSESKDLKS
jgi:hypothetical protein